MGATEGIRECVADVRVQSVDIATGAVTADYIGECAVTSAKLGGSAVTSDKLGNSAVTTDKLSLSVGRWVHATFTSGTNTFTGTAAFSVMFPSITVTAAAAGFVTMGTTATATAIMACTSTVAGTYAGWGQNTAFWTNQCIITAANCNTMVEISAAGSLIVCAENTVRGKYTFFYITTV